jgi:hypothetical protein
MAYSQQTWADSPATSSPLSAARMNHMEAGIGEAVTQYPSTTRTLSCSNGGQGGQSTAFVGGAATTLSSITNLSFRIPFRLPANTTAWRIKVRNYNSGASAGGTGSLTIDKIIVGQATTQTVGTTGPTGNFLGSTATTVVTSGTIPNTASYYTIPSDITASGDQVQDGVDWLLAIACHGSSQTLQTGIGQCWYWTDTTSAVNPATASSGGTSYWIPLDVVIEYDTTNRKKALMVLGDSIPEGTQGPSWALNGSAVNAAPTPWYYRHWDQWAAKRGDYMVQNHSLYGILAQTLVSSSHTEYTRQGTGSAHFDAAVIAIGSNDMASATSLANIQSYWTSCLTNLRAIVGTAVPIYAVNFSPYSGATTTKEQVRKQFNQWLSQLPYGIAGVVDVDSQLRVSSASATQQTTANIDTQLTCDMVHPSYQGTTAFIKAIEATIP